MQARKPVQQYVVPYDLAIETTAASAATAVTTAAAATAAAVADVKHTKQRNDGRTSTTRTQE